jgi:hypothetical protein
MAGIDHRMLLSGQTPQIQGPMDMAQQGLTIKGLLQSTSAEDARVAADRQKSLQQAQQQAILSDLYRIATNPDGTVDQQKLVTGLAQAGMGTAIPAIQKADAELADKRAETAGRTATTGKTAQETLYNGLKMADNMIASLAARPDVNETMVMGELGRLVSLGAFDIQAQHEKTTPDEYAMKIAATMPVGNPVKLKQWLVQVGMRTADATKRLEAMLPKYDEQDRGGTIDEGTIDPITGKRTSGTTVKKTNTPGEQLSAATQARGQNMSDARAREFNDIQRQAQRTQIVTGGDGRIMLVDKGTGLARPTADLSGKTVEDPTAPAVKNRATTSRITAMIPMARDMLKSGPTSSGVGAKVDEMNAYLGIGTKSADQATSLEALSGWLVANVPRMEGPQSNFDVLNYQTMAGKIGDRTLPVSARLAALESVEKIIKKYDDSPASVVRKPAASPKPAGGTPSIDDFFIR